jgi:hypothetical protein
MMAPFRRPIAIPTVETSIECVALSKVLQPPPSAYISPLSTSCMFSTCLLSLGLVGEINDLTATDFSSITSRVSCRMHNDADCGFPRSALTNSRSVPDIEFQSIRSGETIAVLALTSSDYSWIYTEIRQ